MTALEALAEVEKLLHECPTKAQFQSAMRGLLDQLKLRKDIETRKIALNTLMEWCDGNMDAFARGLKILRIRLETN